MSACILVTGFEPYGGMPSNPAFDAMHALDGETVAGHRIAGRALPVSIARIADALHEAVSETVPAAVLCLGLYPGEPAIRIERVGLNLADFKLADNEGSRMADELLSANGPAARWSSLPVRAIERALLEAGIPARLSQTAGTYLCNACLYRLLVLAEELARPMPCGFLHLPMTPELAATRLLAEEAAALERDPPPSMELSRIVKGIRIAAGVAVSSLAGHQA